MKKEVILAILILVFISGCAQEMKEVAEGKPKEEIKGVIEEKVILPEHCKDGVYNKGEQGLDCGWSCPNECDFIKKSGELRKDEVWSGNILITESVTIPKGKTLIINPGTIVKFKHFRPPQCEGNAISLVVEGTLKAIGAPKKRIWFTSGAPDPINGDWYGINFYNSKSSDNVIKYAIVEFGTQDINFWNSYALVSHSIIRYNNWENVYLEFHSNPKIQYSMIYDAGYLGLAMEQMNNPIIEYNYFSNAKNVFSDFSEPIIRHNVFDKTGFSAASEGTVDLSDNTIEGDVQFERGVTSANINHNNLKGNMLNFMDIKSVKLNDNNIQSEVNVENADSIDATENWWNTDDKEKIEERIGDSNKVLDYSNFLKAPVTGITTEIDFGYNDIKNFELGYIPGDKQKEKYPFIYPAEDKTRKIVDKKLAGDMLWTASYDGKYLYVTTDLEVIKIDPNTFKEVDRFKTASTWLRGMVSDGEHIWVNGYDDGMIHEYDPESHNLVSSFDVSDIEGIAKGTLGYANGYLYILVGMPNRLYKYTKEGKQMSVKELDFGGWGLAHDGEYFYTCSGDKILKFDEEGNIEGMIWSGSEECWDVVWINEELWSVERTNENWFDEKLYRIEIKNDQLLWDC